MYMCVAKGGESWSFWYSVQLLKTVLWSAIEHPWVNGCMQMNDCIDVMIRTEWSDSSICASRTSRSRVSYFVDKKVLWQSELWLPTRGTQGKCRCAYQCGVVLCCLCRMYRIIMKVKYLRLSETWWKVHQRREDQIKTRQWRWIYMTSSLLKEKRVGINWKNKDQTWYEMIVYVFSILKKWKHVSDVDIYVIVRETQGLKNNGVSHISANINKYYTINELFCWDRHIYVPRLLVDSDRCFDLFDSSDLSWIGFKLKWMRIALLFENSKGSFKYKEVLNELCCNVLGNVVWLPTCQSQDGASQDGASTAGGGRRTCGR